MPTRLYFDAAGMSANQAEVASSMEAPIAPSSWSAGWNKTAGAASDARLHGTKPSASSGNISNSNSASGSAGHFTAVRRHISQPLKAQTISGNIKGQIQASEPLSSDDFTVALAIKVIQPDGSDRGVLLAVTGSDDVSSAPPELATTPRNRKFRDAAENTSIALSPLAVSAGDRVVVEYGIRQVGTSTSAPVFQRCSGDSTDLPEDDTANSSDNPWIEFDTDIAFAAIAYHGSSSTPRDAGTTSGGASDPTSVAPPLNMIAGDLVIMIGQQRGTGSTLAVDNDGGQSWTAEAAIGETNITARVFWCIFDGTWDADPSINFSAAVCNTVVMHVFRAPAGSIWSVNVALAELDIAAASTQTITGQDTIGNAPTVTLAGWFTADDNTWGAIAGVGWENCGYDQYRNTSGSDQSCTFAFQSKTGAGATGNVSKTQQSLGTDAATSFIVTWAATPSAQPARTMAINRMRRAA